MQDVCGLMLMRKVVSGVYFVQSQNRAAIEVHKASTIPAYYCVFIWRHKKLKNVNLAFITWENNSNLCRWNSTTNSLLNIILWLWFLKMNIKNMVSTDVGASTTVYHVAKMVMIFTKKKSDIWINWTFWINYYYRKESLKWRFPLKNISSYSECILKQH